MHPEECQRCERETPWLTEGFCRGCYIIMKHQGGYVHPQYLTGHDEGFAEAAEKLVGELEELLAKHATFYERYGE